MSDAAFRYREIAPPLALQPYVQCIWRMSGAAQANVPPEPIIPDGCAELVLNFGDAFIRHTPDGSHHQPLRLVAGQMTQAVTIQPSGRIDLWGVRFHPWSAAPFLGFSGTEMRHRLVSVDDLSASLERSLSNIADAPSEQAQFDMMVVRLLRRLEAARPMDSRVRLLTQTVIARGEPFTVRGLARHAGLSVRRVQLLFRDDVGLSPKQMHRIHRYQCALAIHRAHPRLTWSAVAARAGYHDHAHLIHESRDIAGRTPSELMGAARELTDAFLPE
ncbi:MAG TPA: AraC family transcriptional regulator [Gemmatimonadaceae bacterium]|jgi:AraC-like DNA-binding protein